MFWNETFCSPTFVSSLVFITSRVIGGRCGSVWIVWIWMYWLWPTVRETESKLSLMWTVIIRRSSGSILICCWFTPLGNRYLCAETERSNTLFSQEVMVVYLTETFPSTALTAQWPAVEDWLYEQLPGIVWGLVTESMKLWFEAKRPFKLAKVILSK